MNWCRLYNETSSDPKFAYIAANTGVTPATVLGVWLAMLNVASANQGEDRGTLRGWNMRVAAFQLGLEPPVLMRIRAAMEGFTLDGDRLIAWDRRQFESDSSRQRTKEWRNRKYAKSADVTSQPPAGDVTTPAGDGAVTSARRVVTACDAPEQNRTDQKIPLEVSDDTSNSCERNETEGKGRAQPARAAAAPTRHEYPPDFERVFRCWPAERRVGKRAALKAYQAALKRGASPDEIFQIAHSTEWDTREGCRYVPHPATWLNRDGWLDGLDLDAAEQPHHERA